MSSVDNSELQAAEKKIDGQTQIRNSKLAAGISLIYLRYLLQPIV
jgi:hypothetical protein